MVNTSADCLDLATRAQGFQLRVASVLVSSRSTPTPARLNAAMSNPSLAGRPFDTSLVDTEWPFEIPSLHRTQLKHKPVVSAQTQRNFNVTSPELYLTGILFDQFRAMRERARLTWHKYGDDGFWAVTRHADVEAVSRTPDIFSSGIGHTNLWDLEADALAARRSIIDTDPPEHRRLRKLR